MPLLYRYGRRYRRYRKYRRFYRRYRRSYGRRYVNGSSKSQVRMKTSVDTTFAATAGHGRSGTGAEVVVVSPLTGANSTTSAANSALYRTYCNLYEEVKIIGCKVSLAVVSPVGSSDIPSLQIYTCWDRKRGYGEANPNVNDIKNAATYNVATAVNNNVAKLTRSCYASDLIEKATWFDSTLDPLNNNRNLAWVAAALNPNMFCPSFAMFLNCPSKDATQSVNISLAITYYFAFRNPRYGGSSTDAKLSDLGARSSLFMDDDDDDEMGDGPVPALPDSPPAADEEPPDPEAVAKRKAQINASQRAKSQARVVAARQRLLDQAGPVRKN